MIHKSYKNILLTAFLSFLYSFFIVYGLYIKYFLNQNYSIFILFLLMLLLAIPLYFIINKIWVLLDLCANFKTLSVNKVKCLILLSSFILFCWCIVWLASWPGYYCYDTYVYNKFIESEYLTTLHPVFHTILVGNILKFGCMLFGNFNRAVAFYILFQMLICFLLVVRILHIMIFKDAPRFLIIISVGFFALCPSISLFVLCTTKDVMFSIYLILFSINIYFLFQKNNKKQIAIRVFFCFVLSFLLVVQRNNGIYALIPSIIIIAVLLVKTGTLKITKFVVLAVGGGLILGVIFNGPISTVYLKAKNSDSFREMISVPAAQLARSAQVDTSMDSSLFKDFGVDVEKLIQAYSKWSTNSDGFRKFFWTEKNERKLEFIKFWIQEFPNHPRAYLESFLKLTEGAWNPFVYIHAYNDGGSYKTESSIFAANSETPVQIRSKFPELQKCLWSWSRSNPFKAYPFFAWTSSVAFFLWLYLLVLIRALIKRNIAVIAFCIPMLFVVCTSLLGPTVLIRYYWFLFLAAPFFLFLLIHDLSDKRQTNFKNLIPKKNIGKVKFLKFFNKPNNYL